ncbi:MAG: hypothetical protein MJ188_11275 [Treponema sp.]|nr:hypothetical protein [Treponema sp.]
MQFLEFNDKDTFDYEMYAPKWTASAENIENDMDKTYWSIKENITREVNKTTYINDGILHMPEQHWIDENGTAHLRDSEVYGFNTSWFGNPIKYPYTHKKGLVEIKFKMPRVKGVSFALFEVLKTGHRTDAVETEINANGWAFIEVDYAEIKSKDNTIEPLGSMHIYNPTKDIYKTTDYYYNEETDYLKRIEVDDDWYNQWHIMQAVWEDFKMNIFYDGELFRTVVWPEEYGNPVGDFSFILRPEYCGWDSDLDWTDTAVHDFQIDYIRVYNEEKD